MEDEGPVLPPRPLVGGGEIELAMTMECGVARMCLRGRTLRGGYTRGPKKK